MLQSVTGSWWAFVLSGVAAVILGVLALVVPGPTLSGLLVVFAAYFIFDGVLAIFAGLGTAGGPYWMLVIGGIVGIAIGLFTLSQPDTTAVALVYLIGIWAIVRGVSEVVSAVYLRRVIDGEWLLALAGVFSVAFGVLVILQPSSGILAILWLIGIYAIFLGVVFVGLGIRLRGVGKDLTNLTSQGAASGS